MSIFETRSALPQVVDISFLQQINDCHDHKRNEDVYDLHSDISDDPFEEDAHLVIYGSENIVDKEEDHHHINSLSIDEVPFDRDIRYINVAIASQPKPKSKVVPGLAKRVLNQINSTTSGNLKEIKHLDEHYKKLSKFKKKYDSQSQSKSKESTSLDSKNRSRDIGGGGNKDREKNFRSSHHSHSQSMTPKIQSRIYPSTHPIINSNTISLEDKKDLHSTKIKTPTSSLNITGGNVSTILRPEAPEFIPTWGNSLG